MRAIAVEQQISSTTNGKLIMCLLSLSGVLNYSTNTAPCAISFSRSTVNSKDYLGRVPTMEWKLRYYGLKLGDNCLLE
jgi:hypothetical protein